MRLRHILIALSIAAVAALVAAGFALEYRAQTRSAELWNQVSRSAPNGATRAQVESALKAEGLPFSFSAPSNVIVSPWIPIGRYRLLWKTQFYYQISFNEQGQVIGFSTERFNEGL